MNSATPPQPDSDEAAELGVTSSVEYWPTIPRDRPLAEAIAVLVDAYTAEAVTAARQDELHQLAKEHAETCGAIQTKPSRDDCTLPQQLINRIAQLQGSVRKEGA